MTFFNKKEDVIEIQLTQYGKYLLSQGKFKPVEYAFFDNDIIYDTGWADAAPPETYQAEAQSDSEQRIKDAIRPKTQYVFSPGPEKQIREANIIILHNRSEEFLSFVSEFNDTSIENTRDSRLTEEQKIKLQKEMIQPSSMKDYVLSLPLGTSDYASNFSPSWSVEFINGTLTGSQSIHSSSSGIVPIPQLYATGSFEIYTTFIDDDGELVQDYVPDELDLGIFADSSFEASLDYGTDFAGQVFEDGSLFQIKEDYFLMQVFERNTTFDKENFEIEVYKCLRSEDEKDNDAQELLLFRESDDEPLTPRHVEYYFHLLVDNEIDDEIFCASEHLYKKQHIFSDQDRTFDCIDIREPIGNVYETFITDEDYEEPC